MRAETKEGLSLAVKSILVLVGVLLAANAAVELIVAGFRWRNLGWLALGLALVAAPLAVAFRDAVRAARNGNNP